MTIRNLKELYSRNRDLNKKISKDFNALIRKVHTQLSISTICATLLEPAKLSVISSSRSG